MLSHKKWRLRICVHLLVPMMGCCIIGGGRREDGCTVDENIQTAESDLDTAKHFFDVGHAPEVRLKQRAALSDLFCFSLTRSVMNGDPRAAASQFERDFAANPFCRTGD